MGENIELFNLLNDQNNANTIENIRLLQELENVQMNRRYKVFPRIDPFSRFNDDEFRRRYRMNKQLVNQLFDMLDGNDTLDPLVCHFMRFISNDGEQ